MLEHFGTGEHAFFGDVADNHDGGAGGFGGADEDVAGVGDLAGGAGGGGDFVEGEGLDGVDDDELVFAVEDGLGDVVSRGGGGEIEVGDEGAFDVDFGLEEAHGAKFDLGGGFFAGDVEDGAGLGDGFGDLEEEGGFADAGLASEEGDGAAEDAAAEDKVELGEAGSQAGFFFVGFDVGEGGGFDDAAGARGFFEEGFGLDLGFLLEHGVPFAAVGALPGPFGRAEAAFLADESRVGFCHFIPPGCLYLTRCVFESQDEM